jgi:hypothetical protein
MAGWPDLGIRWRNVVPAAGSGRRRIPSPPARACGDPAAFVVDMIWLGGRRPGDPVREQHVMDVVEAISREQARRNGE